jgi:hypothetical protein
MMSSLMPYHRFKVDQAVLPSTPRLPCECYTIVQLLPLVHGEPHYWVRGACDGLERAVLEREIRALVRGVQVPHQRVRQTPSTHRQNTHALNSLAILTP